MPPHRVVTHFGLSLDSSLLAFLSSKVRHQTTTMYVGESKIIWTIGTRFAVGYAAG
jgi:hypothetical protein